MFVNLYFPLLFFPLLLLILILLHLLADYYFKVAPRRTMHFGSGTALDSLVPKMVGVTEPSYAPGEGRIISSLEDVDRNL